MTPDRAQIIALLVLLFAMLLVLLMGYLLWLQRRAVAEQDRQREAERQWRSVPRPMDRRTVSTSRSARPDCRHAGARPAIAVPWRVRADGNRDR